MIDNKTKQVDGIQLLKACRYNTELVGVCIAMSDNWKEVLESIQSPQLIAEVGTIVKQVRESLGKED